MQWHTLLLCGRAAKQTACCSAHNSHQVTLHLLRCCCAMAACMSRQGFSLVMADTPAVWKMETKSGAPSTMQIG